MRQPSRIQHGEPAPPPSARTGLLLLFAPLVLCGPRPATAQLPHADCISPWTAPDRWEDADGDGSLDPQEDYDPLATGYVSGDAGAVLVLRPEASREVIEGLLLGIAVPGAMAPGSRCAPVGGQPGDPLPVRTAPAGAVIKAMDALVSLDPLARWDADTGTIVNSAYGRSPRRLRVLIFDPGTLSRSGRRHVVPVKVLDLFVEAVEGREIGSRVVCVDCSDAAAPFLSAYPSTWGRIKAAYGSRASR